MRSLEPTSTLNTSKTQLDEYVHDTIADYSKLHEATGWEPAITFEEGVSRVCEPYQ